MEKAIGTLAGTIAVFMFIFMIASIAALAVAPILLFLVKSGAMRFLVKATNEKNEEFTMIWTSILFSALFSIAMVVLSLLWHAGIAMTAPELNRVFMSYYDPTIPIVIGPQQFDNTKLFFNAWWNMTSEVWPFFYATTIALLFGGAMDLVAKDNHSTFSLVSIFIPPLVASIAFICFLYGDEILRILHNRGLGDVVINILRRGLDELKSVADPFVVIAQGKSFRSWFESEVVKMHASLFRMTSLYPKFFWIFILWGLVHSFTRPQDV